MPLPVLGESWKLNVFFPRVRASSSMISLGLVSSSLGGVHSMCMFRNPDIQDGILIMISSYTNYIIN